MKMVVKQKASIKSLLLDIIKMGKEINFFTLQFSEFEAYGKLQRE